jgi:hypothetical protein
LLNDPDFIVDDSVFKKDTTAENHIEIFNLAPKTQ